MKSLAIATAAITILFSSSIHAALVERLGGLAYYDTDADLTWLADANYAMTSGYEYDGTMTWAAANAWAAGLDLDGISGADGWRLPTTDNCGGYNCTGSEMGNLYYNVLGNSLGYRPNSGPFSNIISFGYWSSTEYAPDTLQAWTFVMGNGNQNIYLKANVAYAWAVYEGDISAVPVPAAVWLFGSGLLGLIGIARRRKAA